MPQQTRKRAPPAQQQKALDSVDAQRKYLMSQGTRAAMVAYLEALGAQLTENVRQHWEASGLIFDTGETLRSLAFRYALGGKYGNR